MSTDPTATRSIEEQKAKDLAIASMAVSIFLVFFSLGLLSFIGAIMGHIALGKLKVLGTLTHRGYALSGIFVGWIFSILAWLFVAVLGAAVIAAFI